MYSKTIFKCLDPLVQLFTCLQGQEVAEKCQDSLQLCCGLSSDNSSREMTSLCVKGSQIQSTCESVVLPGE